MRMASISRGTFPLSYWTFHNVCLILCEIIKAVPASHWDAFILKLWKDDFLPQFDETHRSDAVYKLICAGLSCTMNEDLAAIVINDCLEVVRENGKYHIVQDLFYHLRTKHSSKVSTAIKPALTDFINKIDTDNDFILLGNLHRGVHFKKSPHVIIHIFTNFLIFSTLLSGYYFVF